MRNIFAKRDGLQIYFPAFNSNTFGNLTTYLDNIVSEAVGCTVHFPSNMQSIIGNWSSVQNGFGGTNTTVLFDLPATSQEGSMKEVIEKAKRKLDKIKKK